MEWHKLPSQGIVATIGRRDANQKQKIKAASASLSNATFWGDAPISIHPNAPTEEPAPPCVCPCQPQESTGYQSGCVRTSLECFHNHGNQVGNRTAQTLRCGTTPLGHCEQEARDFVCRLIYYVTLLPVELPVFLPGNLLWQNQNAFQLGQTQLLLSIGDKASLGNPSQFTLSHGLFSPASWCQFWCHSLKDFEAR